MQRTTKSHLVSSGRFCPCLPTNNFRYENRPSVVGQHHPWGVSWLTSQEVIPSFSPLYPQKLTNKKPHLHKWKSCVQNYGKNLHKATCGLALEGVWELWCKKMNFKSRASSFFKTSDEGVITVYLFHGIHADPSDHYWEIISAPPSAMNTSDHRDPKALMEVIHWWLAGASQFGSIAVLSGWRSPNPLQSTEWRQSSFNYRCSLTSRINSYL